MSRSVFGWSLPPGCSSADIERAFGNEGPLDCPVCADGIEVAGADCDRDPNHGPVCPKHGCITCEDLEKRRRYCTGCGNYLRGDNSGAMTDDGKLYCGDPCIRAASVPDSCCDVCGAPYVIGLRGVCRQLDW